MTKKLVGWSWDENGVEREILAEPIDEAYREGLRVAITDALLMFKDIEKARQLPATAQAVQQYIATGRQLERFLALSKL